MANYISVKLVNNFAGGAETDHNVEVGTKVGQFISSRISGANASNTVTRVRRENQMFGNTSDPIVADFMLANGDLVSVTPAKTSGARLAA